MSSRITYAVFFVALLLAIPVFGQDTKFVPLTGEDVSRVDLAPFMTKAFRADAKLSDFVNAMFRAAIGIGAMLAVLQLARAGFLYMGSDMWHKKEQAKHLMSDAIVGLLILMAVWLVLKQINPQLLNLDVLKGIGPVGGSGMGGASTDSDFERATPGGGLYQQNDLPTQTTGTEFGP